MSDNLQHQATLGQQAQQVLDNPAFIEAFNRLDAHINERIRSADLRDPESCRLLLQMGKVSDLYKSKLIGMVEGGKMASHKIELDSARGESRLRAGLRSVTGR